MEGSGKLYSTKKSLYNNYISISHVVEYQLNMRKKFDDNIVYMSTLVPISRPRNVTICYMFQHNSGAINHNILFYNILLADSAMDKGVTLCFA
jgi:hypothetical protein